MDHKGSAHFRKVTTVHYFALLLGPESTSAPDPDAAAAEMAAYQAFHAKAATAIRAGDALTPSATGVRITGGPDAPAVTDGPFAEGAEVAGGYYVFEAENLDEALALARDIPAARYGAVEVWPMVDVEPAREAARRQHWLALLLEPPINAVAPGTPEWDAGIAAAQRVRLPQRAITSTAARPSSPATATTVRVRDDQATLTDGPYHRGRGSGQRLLLH